MSEPTNSTREEPAFLSRAVRVLRKLLGITQAEFAAQIERTPTTVVRYETYRPPTGDILLDFYRIAVRNGHVALAKLFELGWTIEHFGKPPYQFRSRLSLSDGSRVSAGEILTLYEQAGRFYIRASEKVENLSISFPTLPIRPGEQAVCLPQVEESADWELLDLRNPKGYKPSPMVVRHFLESGIEDYCKRRGYSRAILRETFNNFLHAEDSEQKRYAMSVIATILEPWKNVNSLERVTHAIDQSRDDIDNSEDKK
jgi:transcriptional regulator with XRE-family HTH domain